MSLAQFFQNLLQLFIWIQIPAGTVALVGGGLAAAFKLIYWHTLFEILGGLPWSSLPPTSSTRCADR